MALLRVGQAADGVLDDHHRAVDDNAEVQRAEAHQVGADFVGEHAGEGEQHRQGNHHRGDQRRPDIAQEQKQHRDHQQRPLKEVLLHRGNGFFDEVGTVVDRHRHHAFGQRAVDVFELFRHGLDTLRLFSPININTVPSTTSRPFSVGGASAQFTADLDLGHITHANRRAVADGDDDIGDVIDGTPIAPVRGSAVARHCARYNRRRRWRCCAPAR